MTSPPPPPVPKPRRCYRDSRSSTYSLERADENLQPALSDGAHKSTDEDAHSALSHSLTFPTLAGVTGVIATNIPSLSGIAATIGGSTPPPPPSLDSMTNSLTTHIPDLAEAANTVANPASFTSSPPAVKTSAAALNPTPSTTPAPAANLGSILNSLANIPSFTGIVSGVGNLAESSSPSAPSLPKSKPRPSSLTGFATGDTHTDVGALSQLVTSALDPTAGVVLPPVEGTAGATDEVLSPAPQSTKAENPSATMLACWTTQEEADSDSSNEGEDPGVSTAPSTAEEDPASAPMTNDDKILSINSGRLKPTRPAPPPPSAAGRSGKSMRQKTPRAATIRVSRKKGAAGRPAPQSTVVRASWLDVWKGFRYNVLWAMLDGQLMSLWKKRTDRFSEVLFHVSSITNVKKQDNCRFSVYFRKKHYDFMAHNDEVQDGWVTSLLATRGHPSPTPPEIHGQITIKDMRGRAYAAVWGHDLWIYPNKEGFQLGVASFSVPLNVASVKSTGKHSFSLITPYRTFNMSVDSSKDLSTWLDSLSSTIQSALSCSQVALRLWENPYNKVCGDCSAANPEWASVNLLLVMCQRCAGHHRALGSNLSKVRSLRMDNKIWTEPLIQLFVTYGNQLANQVWAPAVPAVEQLLPESTDEERSKFIKDKYSSGRYRRAHALASFPSMMEQRLYQVVCTDDVEETMSLICSGAKVSSSDPQTPSLILLAERANQALQTELLRVNEYTEVPPHQPQSARKRLDSAPSGEEEEELHGKLEDDRFLFSLENESAACDVLDLREVLSVFLKDGPAHQFEIVTLRDQLICAADDREGLLNHLVHILKVVLPGGVSYAEVGGAFAVSKVCIVEVGRASNHPEAWLLLWEDGVSIYPIYRQSHQPLMIDLSMLSHHDMNPSENLITMVTADRRVSLRFEELYSCQTWFNHLQKAVSNQSSAPPCSPAANQSSAHRSLYPVMDVRLRGSVPPAIERCISHITTYGLKVEGVYRRCGLASKVSQLVEALMTSPNSAPLESDEQGVLNTSSALKQYVRQRASLIPDGAQGQWLQAAGIPDEARRFKEYRRLLRQLPDDSRAILNALFGHFYMVQVFSQVNKMSAHNLAVVLAPSLFQAMNQDLITLNREFIIHHTLLFLTPDSAQREEEEQITTF
ncbi:arf-GAP with Rho-GAP domain, ANK repeat and PH domain-containing protein 1 [Archocentrus centrarchus]|uniref:arf-GAP with Rho-GAP domain, ANK repeat and PH domain-containing protein 1 n=1 Tax=Archocentrus centrarchus TaxID=63155 RepID=UPI0011E9BF06|nr:arf-GAP with Rho-GAP domain, ANK repeat and PH domain-containing protein 1-like [Archocentrus centrarchus]